MQRLRVAVLADFDDVWDVFQCATRQMCTLRIFQWDDIYPSQKDIRDDIENGHMYLLTEGDAVLSVVTLNTQQDEVYQTAAWEGQNPAVIHRLCVHPRFWNKGAGRQTMVFAEQQLMNSGFDSVRLDAFSQNPSALALYERMGYKRKGEVRFRKGLFYLYEKLL